MPAPPGKGCHASARFSQIFLSSVLFVLPIFAQNVSIPKPPETPLHSVTDEYFGNQVTDDYQWLENGKTRP